MVRKIRNITLVSPDDANYRAFCARHAEGNLHLRPKKKPTAIEKVSRLFEEYLRSWIGLSLKLTEHRILAYEVLRNGYYVKQYRELDGVCGSRDNPECFFEIKVSCNRKRIGQGRKQLKKTGEIARKRWADFKSGVFFIDLIPERTNSPLDDLSRLSLMQQLQSWNEGDASIPCIHLAANDLWNWAVKENLVSDSDLFRQAVAEAKSNANLREERRRLSKRGIPESEWSEHLKVKNAAPEYELFSLGELPNQSALGAALQTAMLQACGKEAAVEREG